MKTWDWDSASEIGQERQSQYVIPYPVTDVEPAYPCYIYNRGDCKHEGNHFSGGVLLSHICSFCFGLDGLKEAHISRSCGR